MRNLLTYFALTSLILMSACQPKTERKVESEKTFEEAETLQAAEFNADSAYHFVAQQVKFGPRVPNTPAHEKCAAWLESTMKKYIKNVVVQSFKAKAYDGTTLKCKNIIASFDPSNPNRVLLCSHWDSRPWADNDPDSTKHRTPVDAANDGASGVGILIEIARQLALKPSKIGVDLLLFDAEDYGAPMDANYTGNDDWALGSQYWSYNPHTLAYGARFGILLDMVGAENAVFTLEGISMEFAPDFMQRIWKIGSQLGYSAYFSNDRTNSVTDDHLYINVLRQIPTIDIIQHDPSTRSNFYENWHTTKDNMAGISRETLMAVGQTVMTVVRNEK